MRLKAARSAGALYLLSPVAVRGLTLKTRRPTLQGFFAQFSQKGERENPWRTGGLASTRVNRLAGRKSMVTKARCGRNGCRSDAQFRSLPLA